MTNKRKECVGHIITFMMITSIGQHKIVEFDFSQ